MSMSFVYHSPTTPGNPGFSIDLGTQAVRLGDMPGLMSEAELGAVGISSLRFDDPSGTAGHNGDAIKGLKQISVNEGACAAGGRRIGEFYIGDRRYYRGTRGQSDSLRTGAARVIDMALVDINAFLSFRVFETNGSNTSFKRPAETDVARVEALLTVAFLSDTLYNELGFIDTSHPVNMDAVDYDGQRASDVLNDCAQQSGKNFFMIYNEPTGHYNLFYALNDSSLYQSAMQISNVLTDVDNVVTFAPNEDAVLVRDPSRIAAGVLIQNGSNSVYRTRALTSYVYGWRDAVANSPNLKTLAQTKQRADRYLTENDSEDDRITFTVKVPAAHVNDCYQGQALQCKFSHLPGYESYRWCRVLTRTVKQDEEDDSQYNITYEVTSVCVLTSDTQTGIDLLGSTIFYSAIATTEYYRVNPYATLHEESIWGLFGTFNGGMGFLNAGWCAFGIPAQVVNAPVGIEGSWTVDIGPVAVIGEAHFSGITSYELGTMSLWASDDDVTYHEVITGTQVAANETVFWPGAMLNGQETGHNTGSYVASGPWSKVTIPDAESQHQYWKLVVTDTAAGSGLTYYGGISLNFVRLIEGVCT